MQPHGKCENGLRSGPYVLAAARWPWQIVQEMRACRRRATRQGARRSGANHADLQAAMPARLSTARQVRKRFTFWVIRLGGRALALADNPRNASMSPARDAPRARRSGANHAALQAAAPTRLATARQVRKRFRIWVRLGWLHARISWTICQGQRAAAMQACMVGSASPCPLARRAPAKCSHLLDDLPRPARGRQDVGPCILTRLRFG